MAVLIHAAFWLSLSFVSMQGTSMSSLRESLDQVLFGTDEGCRTAVVLLRDKVFEAVSLPLSQCNDDFARTFLSGLARLRSGDACGAVKFFEPIAGEKNETRCYARMLLGRSLDGCSMYQRAAREYGSAASCLSRGKDRNNAVAARARVLFSAGDYRGAASAASRIVKELATGFESLAAGLASCAEGDLTKGAILIKSALKKGLGATNHRLAVAKLKSLVRKGVKAAELNSMELLELAGRLLDKGMIEPAKEELAGLFQKQGHDRCRLKMLEARIAFASRDYEESFSLFNSVYKDGDCRDLHASAGRWVAKTLAYQGRHEQALAANAEVWSRYPGTFHGKRALYYQAYLSMFTGRFIEAAELFGKYLRLAGIPARGRAGWYMTWSLLKAGRYEQVLKFLAKKPRLGGETGTARFWQARVLELTGRKESARKAYNRILSASPWSYYWFRSAARLIELGQRGVCKTVAKALGLDSSVEKIVGADSGSSGICGPASLKKGLALIESVSAFSRLGLFEQAGSRLAGKVVPSDVDRCTLYVVASALDRMGLPHVAFNLASKVKPMSSIKGDSLLVRLLYPTPYKGEVAMASKRHGVNSSLLYAVMRRESAFYPGAVSRAGAIGLMQLMPETGRALASAMGTVTYTEDTLYDPAGAVDLAAFYLAKLLHRYAGNHVLAAAAYNAGEDKVDQWIAKFGKQPLEYFVEDIPFDETRSYVKSVLASEAVYKLVYDSGGTCSALSDSLARFKDAVLEPAMPPVIP